MGKIEGNTPLKLEIVYNEEGYAIMGGDGSNPTWEEYLLGFKEEFWPHLEMIKTAIKENGLLGITGEEKQDRGISFKFSDGTHFGFSWRAWGDLMQAIVNKKEGYMKYYM